MSHDQALVRALEFIRKEAKPDSFYVEGSGFGTSNGYRQVTVLSQMGEAILDATQGRFAPLQKQIADHQTMFDQCRAMDQQFGRTLADPYLYRDTIKRDLDCLLWFLSELA